MDSKDFNGTIDLTGQIALVTGGGRGLGRVISRALASAGAAVAVLARSTDQLAETAALIEADGGRAFAFTTDVTDDQAVKQVVGEIQTQFGGSVKLPSSVTPKFWLLRLESMGSVCLR